MTIIDKSMAVTSPNTSSSPGRKILHIVIHYTATSASAQDNIRYFRSGNRDASADFFVNKDGSIYQYNADPNNYYTWHCGDGRGKYGITNAQSVGIENVSAGEDFTSQQINALKDLVGYLMKTYNVPAQNVVRHYDASRKRCPAPYIDQDKWNALWKTITGGSGNISSSGTSNQGSNSSGGGGFSISYDRKDPLVVEFGYALPASDGVGANLGSKMIAKKEISQYTVSAVNTADLLNDIFSIWGFNPSGGGSTDTDSSGGQTVAGQAKTRSGKVLTSGIWKPMPSGQPQTGIIANFTGYDRKWASGTNQRTLYDIWVSQGKPSKYSIAQVSGYFLLAPGRYFSNSAGDILEVKLEGGTSFMALVGDTKGGDTTNEYGHVFGSNGVDVIEWENSSTSQAALTAGLNQWGIYGKKVLGMTNFGTYFQ